jgi:proteasome accessory factor B
MDIRLTGPEELDEETFLIVSRAVQTHRALQFRYRKHATKTWEQRTVHPYQLVCANNRWYTIGHDPKRKAIRVFVLARMKNVVVLPEVFTRPKDFRVDDYLKGSFGIFRGWEDFEVVIDLDRWAADVVRGRKWHLSQSVTELPRGETRLSFRLNNLEEIEPWVLSWGLHATVVRPKALVDRIRRAAAELQRRYAQPQKRSGLEADGELALMP